MRVVVALLLSGMGLAAGSGAVGAATGDALYTRDNDVALHTAPSPDAPVALRVSRSYRLTEVDRRDDWIRVEPYNVEIVGGAAWVRDHLVGPEPRDMARPPQPPQSSTSGDAAGCRLLLDAGEAAALEFDEGCPVVVMVIDDDDRSVFGLFGAVPGKPIDPRPPSGPAVPGTGIVPPFTSSPVPPFTSSPVPPLVAPSR